MRFGLRSNNPAALEQATPHLPLGWQAAPVGEVDILYSLRLAPPSQRKGQRNYHLLYCGSALLARSLELPPLLTTLELHAELLTAFRASDCLFIHAQEFQVTLDRIEYFQRQVRHLRQVETNPPNYRLSVSGYLAELDRMNLEVRDYLWLHPSEISDVSIAA